MVGLEVLVRSLSILSYDLLESVYHKLHLILYQVYDILTQHATSKEGYSCRASKVDINLSSWKTFYSYILHIFVNSMQTILWEKFFFGCWLILIIKIQRCYYHNIIRWNTFQVDKHSLFLLNGQSGGGSRNFQSRGVMSTPPHTSFHVAKVSKLFHSWTVFQTFPINTQLIHVDASIVACPQKNGACATLTPLPFFFTLLIVSA